MNTISYSIIEPIAKRIRRARMERRPIELTPEQVTLLDEWMQNELELQADTEWLTRAIITDKREDFISLDQAEKESTGGVNNLDLSS